MLTLYHSNCLDTLCELLLHFLKNDAPDDPFYQENILVQSPGMAQWLKLEIAKRQGIAMSLRFPLPASFIWNMFETVLEDIPRENPYQKSILAWTLMAVLPEIIDAEPMAQLQSYSASKPSALDRWLLCQNIADLFDQYQVYRPDWLANWEAGGNQCAQDLPWQPFLWRTLVARNPEHLHRAKLFAHFFDTLQQKSIPNLPKRLFVFGIPAMAPQYLHALQALSQHCDVHYFLQNPCQEYWGDVRGHMQDSDATGHPLLAAWGKQGRDHVSLLSEIVPQEIDAFVTPTAPCLLAKLQTQILQFDDVRVRQLHDVPEDCLLNADDDSIKIHSCHSVIRELEVLHDQMLTWYEQDATLMPRDILVMVPDIDTYSAGIRAVFGSFAAQDKRFIPFSISDQRLPSAYPLVKAFLQLLDLPNQRCQITPLLDILQLQAVQTRFDIDKQDFEQMTHWVEQSGIRWGLTAHDGAQWQLPALEHNTWEWGLERLFAGFACPDTDLVAGIRPFDLGTGLHLACLGALSEFITALTQTRQSLQQPRSIEDWRVFLHGLVYRFFEPSDAVETQIKALTQAIDRLHCMVECSDYQDTIDYEIIHSCLTQTLEATQTSARFLAGAVNFCTLMPMRAIPFRVVCLLGLNDGDYPRQTVDMSYDLIQRFPRCGDRSRRDDDRYLFLEALESARERLHLSYVGRSVQDNQLLEPSVLLSTLRDYICTHFSIAQYAQDEAHERAEFMRLWLEVHHPLVPYHPQYFTGEQPLSFMHEWLTLAPEDGAGVSVQAVQTSHIELQDWLACIRLPCQFYLQKSLNVFFEGIQTVTEQSEPFVLEGLSDYKTREALLEAYIQQHTTRQNTTYLLESGVFPHGIVGEQVAHNLCEDTQVFYEKLKGYLTAPEPLFDLDLHSHGRQVQGVLSGIYQTCFLRYSLSKKLKADKLIQYWLEYVCYCALVTSPKPFICVSWSLEPYEITPLLSEDAQTELQKWLDLYDEAAVKPVAFFPKTAWEYRKQMQKNPDNPHLEHSVHSFFALPKNGWILGEGDNPYVQRCYPQWTRTFFTEITGHAKQLFSHPKLIDFLETCCA